MEHYEGCEKSWVKLRLSMDYGLRSEEWFKLELDPRVRLCFCSLRASMGGRVRDMQDEVVRVLVPEIVERLNYYRGRAKPSVSVGRQLVLAQVENVIAVDFRNRRRLR